MPCSAPKGLFAFDPAGKELWRQDLGLCPWVSLTTPLTNGPASLPVIHGNVVIVQNDRYRDSFLIVRAGNRQGNSGVRDEMSYRPDDTARSRGGEPQPTIVTNSPRFIRGHDLATGRERWRCLQDPDGEVKVSTPIAAGDFNDRHWRLSVSG